MVDADLLSVDGRQFLFAGIGRREHHLARARAAVRTGGWKVKTPETVVQKMDARGVEAAGLDAPLL